MVGIKYSEGVHGSYSVRANVATREIIKAQGFDGVPRVVDEAEFKKACKASGIIAFRTYNAGSKAVLKKHQDDLYNGDFYTDCNGGAVYGHGMYVAAAKYDENDPNCGQAACDDSYLYGKDAYSMMEKVTMDPDSNILRVPHHGSTRAIKALYKVSYALEKFKTPENAKKLDALKKQAWAGIQNANGYDSSDFEVALRIAIGKTNSAEIESRLDLIDDD